MSELKNILFELSRLDGLGNITNAKDKAQELLNKYVDIIPTENLSVIGIIDCGKDYTVMLDAHIDQIGMIVTDIDDEGFLTVSNAGGIDIRTLPSRSVTVHGKEKITAVFCSTPPHLASGEQNFNDISAIKLDTGLGKKAKETVSLGDYVTFSGEPFDLGDKLVCGRSFDDRAAVACLIEVARRLENKDLPFNVAFLLSDAEELGLRGAKTGAFKIDPNEALVVDVSFGDGIGISPEECGKLGDGAMIGVSPVLDRTVSNKLIKVAEENGIKYQIEILGERTGTNADAISISKNGVKTATVSIPLRNMHSEVEILNLNDLSSVCALLEHYILSGGAKNA